MLFSPYGRVGRMNLVTRKGHSKNGRDGFLTFLLFFKTLHVEWKNSTPRFVLLPERGIKNNSSLLVEVTSVSLTNHIGLIAVDKLVLSHSVSYTPKTVTRVSEI